jgi:MinD-like ATPase involved in chromosome partitioning or flagellar assembly
MSIIRRRIIAFHRPAGQSGNKTTVVLNLAYVLAEMSKQILLVTSPEGYTNLSSHPLHTELQISPYGFSILQAKYFRLLSINRRDQLARLLGGYDFVLLDTPLGPPAKRNFILRLADEVILLLTPEPENLLEGYAFLKQLQQVDPEKPVYLLFNGVQRQSRSHHFAMGQLTRSFLSREFPVLGELPEDGDLLKVQPGLPYSYLYPARPWAKTLRGISRFLLHIDIHLGHRRDLKVHRPNRWFKHEVRHANP